MAHCAPPPIRARAIGKQMAKINYTNIKKVSKKVLEEKIYFLQCKTNSLCKFCEKPQALTTKVVYEFYIEETQNYHFGVFCTPSCLNLWLLQNNV